MRKKQKENPISRRAYIEADVPEAKRSPLTGITGAAAIVMAVTLKLFCTSAELEYPFFDWFEAGLCALGLALLIAQAVVMTRASQREQALRDGKTAALFADAERLPEYDAGAMLARAEEAFSHDGENEAHAFRGASLAQIMQELALFAGERGFRLSAQTARAILCAITSSRVSLLVGARRESAEALTAVLDEYFSTCETDGADRIRILPLGEQEKPGAEKNFRYVLTAEHLPEDMARNVCVLCADWESVPASETKTPCHAVGLAELTALTERALDECLPEEALWKGVDRLEEALTGADGIDNKLWLALERFACVGVACGAQAHEALDEAVAARLTALASDGFASIAEQTLGENRADACVRTANLLGR